MKSRKLLLIIAAIVAFTAGAQEKWTGIARFDSLNTILKAQPNKGDRVVFMGNSITEYWQELHPEFFDGAYICRGISGQTSYQMLVRFREDVIALKPRVVVICAGTNDVAENSNLTYVEERTFGNIVSMVELARAHRIRVVLCSTLPCSEFYWRKTITDIPEKLQSLNKRLQQYARRNRIAYADYYKPLLADDGISLNPALTDDGVHPNREGYRIMEPIINKAIKRAKLRRVRQ